MSAPASGGDSSHGPSPVGIAIGAAFLVLFFNGPAPDTTKLAVLVGLIAFFAVRPKH